MIRKVLCLSFSFLFFTLTISAQDGITITQIAGNLNNPRGVAVLENGDLLVVEAGLGTDIAGDAVGSGTISRFVDTNSDGDYDDAGERTILLDSMPSYNSLPSFRTGHDEVFGLSDLVVTDDGKIFFTKDDPFFEEGHRGTEGFTGDVGIFELNPESGRYSTIINRIATLNSFTYSAENDVFYVVESGFNRVTRFDIEGNVKEVANFETLAHGQQAVPSGVVMDTQSGDVLVALLSGYVYGYIDLPLSFVAGDAKVVRVNPETGAVTDEITDLTTAIDLAIDADGNIFVVELTTQWTLPILPFDFDLYSPDSPPDPGGYARYTGRVTMFPVDGEPVILADNLDTPTNITYHDGLLYVSSGLGTPQRLVWTSDGIQPIEGRIFVISGF